MGRKELKQLAHLLFLSQLLKGKMTADPDESGCSVLMTILLVGRLTIFSRRGLLTHRMLLARSFGIGIVEGRLTFPPRHPHPYARKSTLLCWESIPQSLPYLRTTFTLPLSSKVQSTGRITPTTYRTSCWSTKPTTSPYLNLTSRQ